MKCRVGDDEIVQLLAKHEESMSRLYRAYAERFSEHEAFWTRLGDEEAQHADWLRRLLVKVRQGLGCVRQERFDVAAVQRSLARLERKIRQANEPAFSLSDALAVAIAMEKMLIEAEYFEVFEGQAAEVIQVQYCLADAIKDHYRRIKELQLEVS